MPTIISFWYDYRERLRRGSCSSVTVCRLAFFIVNVDRLLANGSLFSLASILALGASGTGTILLFESVSESPLLVSFIVVVVTSA